MNECISQGINQLCILGLAETSAQSHLRLGSNLQSYTERSAFSSQSNIHPDSWAHSWPTLRGNWWGPNEHYCLGTSTTSFFAKLVHQPAQNFRLSLQACPHGVNIGPTFLYWTCIEPIWVQPNDHGNAGRDATGYNTHPCSPVTN